jgi:hypothetical protein
MIFDPNDPRDIRLVATIDDRRSAKDAAYNEERANFERHHALREREYGSLMRQRHGVCG